MIKAIKKGVDSKKLNEIIEFVKEKKGIEYADSMASEYSQKAKDCLKIFPDSVAKSSLLNLVDFVVERKN